MMLQVERSSAQHRLSRLLLALLLSMILAAPATAQDPLPPQPSSRAQIELAIAPPPHISPTWIGATGKPPNPIVDDDIECSTPAVEPLALSAAPMESSASDPLFPELGGLTSDPDDVPAALDSTLRNPHETGRQNWGKTTLQSLFFLGIMHSWRLVIEPDTRAGLSGPFFKDHWNAVRQLRGWSDGDNFLTNYIGHSMMGAVAGRIWLQNDPKSRSLEFNRDYFKSRLKAFGYSALFSLQFEVGLISEGTIGNATPNEYSRHPFSYADIVITPTVGTALLVAEDLIDRYVVLSVENKVRNIYVRSLLRTILNPTRAFSNLLRFKALWYRDDRPL